jgi:hypothetical protein
MQRQIQSNRMYEAIIIAHVHEMPSLCNVQAFEELLLQRQRRQS